MFTKVLVPLDGSAFAEQALDIAAELATASHATIDLVLVHQPLDMVGIGGDARLSAHDREDRYIERIAAEMDTEVHVPTTHAVADGTPAEAICERAHEVGADLIVMTSHCRTGLKRIARGSVADGVVRGSGVPVLMLRAAGGDLPRGNVRPLFRRILVPVNGSPLSASIAGVVAQLARCTSARVILLRVVSPVPLAVADAMTGLVVPMVGEDEAATRRLVDEGKLELGAVRKVLSDLGCTDVDTEVVVAPDTAAAIVRFAREQKVDMVAMSTHGRGVSRFIVGSVADKVLRDCGLPVLLNRPPDVHIEQALVSEAAVAEQLPALTAADVEC